MFKTSHSIRTVLLWLVLACLLPGIIGIFIFFINEYHSKQEQIERDTLQTARALRQAIDLHFLRVQALAHALSVSEELVQNDLATFHREARRALKAVDLGSNVVLLNDRGQQILNSAADYGSPLSSRTLTETAQSVFKSGKAAISEVFMGPVIKQPVLAAYVPVVQDGQPKYVLAIGILTAQINAILKEQAFPDIWTVSVFDRAGTISARSHNADKFVGQKARGQLLQQLANSKEGVFDGITKENIPVLSIFTTSPVSGYTVVINISRASLLTPLLQNFLGLALAVLVLFSIGIFLARKVGMRIVDSMHALIAPAMALGKGEAVPLAPVSLKEVSEVGQALHQAGCLLQQRAAALTAKEEDLQKFKFFSNNANDAHLLVDQSGHICYANKLTCERTGYYEEELLQMSVFDLMVDGSRQRLADLFEQHKNTRIAPFERTCRRKDGTLFPVEVIATILEHQGEWLMFFVPRDITERKQAEKDIRRAALHDVLTGLPNRTLVMEHCEHLLAVARQKKEYGALLFIDLNRFKPVNDLYGHRIGDFVLQEMGRRLIECVRTEDLVGRLGGDEFVVALSHLNNSKQLVALTAQRITDDLSEPIAINGMEISLTPSIGIAFIQESIQDASSLIHMADVAMYQAKQAGPGNYQVYSPAMDEQAQMALHVERRLKNALNNGGLRLHFQPILNLQTNHLVCAEALVRLVDNESPSLGPDTFISVAETTGLISAIGDWVAAEACRQQVEWRNQGMVLSVAINVSPLQFMRTGFVERVQEIISRSGIEPGHLVIEVTETAVMENIAEAVRILEQIKSMGVRIALDDFGTGYSSLANLSNLPISELKIDKSFVQRIDSDQGNRAVIDAVIALAHSLNLEVVAEGIEHRSALQYLHSRGCHQGQGYFFSRPLPVEAFSDWHSQHCFSHD